MRLTTAQLDRACGALLATAAGDALGAPYEFGPPLAADTPVAMTGGGPWQGGEWTDDTSMAIAIAEVAATGADLRSADAQDRIVRRWVDWAQDAKDVGIQTRSVLAAVDSSSSDRARAAVSDQARAAAAALHRQTGRSGGNGSLMRTAPVALAYLDDIDGLVEAATSISELTHFDPEAGEACVLWCLAIRHAVLTGELDVRVGLDRLPASRRHEWSQRLTSAEASRPRDFDNNGWVVQALQGAWSAIATTPVPADDPPAGSFRADHLRLALEAAVRGGRDADTVAAIAGGVLGATYGASAVPAVWRRVLHGWPGLRARDLVKLASLIAHRGEPDSFDFSYAAYGNFAPPVQHPYDAGVWLGGIGALRELPERVDAVVSLCRVGDADLPSDAELVEVRLIDRNGSEENPNLGYVLNDTARLVRQLREEGRTVLLHCVQAHSRTPTVAALYGAQLTGVPIEKALDDVGQALPRAHPNSSFRQALWSTERG